jgi:hypothetical protein
VAGITGQGTTFNLPNYHGELFTISPTETPFLSAIGGLSGGEATTAKEFTWQTYDLRAGAANRTRLEGANAPTPEERVRAEVSNICQIFHEAVETSYTKSAAVGQFSGLNVPGANPVQDEHVWQVEQALKQIALDVEVTLLTGSYAKPVDNATARTTRGLIDAITTNVNTNATDRALTETIVLDLLQAAWASGGIRESETATLITNGTLKRALTKIFITDKGYTESTRNVGGVSLSTIHTDFGELNLMLDRWMPAKTIVAASLEVCKPRILYIPDKGFLFEEPLAKVGSAERSQIYGEIGLEYGHEAQHAKADKLIP